MSLTRKGHPAAWECGGGASNTGDSQIVTGADGQPLTPVYVRRRGHLACEQHALFLVREGFFKINADHHRGDFELQIYICVCAKLHAAPEWKLIHSFKEGEWDTTPPVKLGKGVDAAQEKALCYHCRCLHFSS